MITEAQKRTLARLDIPTLVRLADEALDGDDQEAAVLYLRTAVRRAPLRQDLRDMLVTAVTERAMRSDPSSAPQPLPRPRPLLDQETTDQAGEDHGPIEAIHFDPKSEDRLTNGPSRGATAANFSRRTQRWNSRSRRRRAPTSALVFGAAVGVLMASMAAGAVWWYFERTAVEPQIDAEQTAAIIQRQDEQMIERALEFEKQNQFDLAIAKLNLLSDPGRKSQLLAGIYARRGERLSQGLKHNDARQAFTIALEFDPDNVDYAFELAHTYYMLGRYRQTISPADAHEKFNQAETFLTKVLDADPSHVPSLKTFALIEIARNNPPAAGNYFRQIIRLDPGGKEADIARRTLVQMGLTP